MLIRIYERPAQRTGGKIRKGDLLKVCVFACDHCGKEFEKRQTQTSAMYNFCSRSCLYEERKSGGVVNTEIKKVCLEKFGVPNAFQSAEIKEKIVMSNREKYGVDHPSQRDESREQQSRKNVQHWQLMSEEQRLLFNQRKKATCLARYGVSAPMKNIEIRRKATQTMLDGGYLKSNGEKFLVKILTTAFPDSRISTQVWKNNVAGRSHPVDMRIDSLDVLVEFDGNYWHTRCVARDEEFNEWCKQNNQRLLRISEEDLCVLLDMKSQRLPRTLDSLEKLLTEKNVMSVKTIVERAFRSNEIVVYCRELLQHDQTANNALISE